MQVLVTGASGGLGPAVMEQFLSEGHSVAGVARSWHNPDGRIKAISADLSKSQECRRAVEEAGEIDALVHVVGGYAGGTHVADTTEDVWHRMIEVNLRSAFLVFHFALPGMTARRRGRIIAIGSRVGVEPVAGHSAYGVSKAGLVHLIRTMALELKDTGVTANIVMPSTIDTEANRAAMPKADFSKWVKPASIAKVVFWLATESACDVNGAVVPVYGKA